MDIQRIFVIGSGTMGSGIAQTAAVCGYHVTVMDIQEKQLEGARAAIRKSVEKMLAKAVITEEQKEAALKIEFVTALDTVAEADLVIEAATENPELKLQIFRNVDALARPGVVLASNTSSISITKIATATSRPERVVGMHFFNPVPMMKLVEIICGLATSDETVALVSGVARKLGKEPVAVKDSPGFIVNRVLVPMINEAVFCLQEGIGTAEAIDTTMKLGANHPIGPLALADLIGLDVVLSIMDVLHRNLGEDKYRPAALLRRMVDAGYLGRKSGRGFYQY